MEQVKAFKDFLNRFELLISKNPHLIKITLSNIFTMRLIGNKTHGDLAEIAISEFINQYMYDFKSEHVGKSLYRAKEHEEDIRVVNEISKINFPISLKAYGNGPLQLSTDKKNKMFPLLLKYRSEEIQGQRINEIFQDESFMEIATLNVLPLIYDETKKRCNIMVFNYDKAKTATHKIVLEKEGKGRKHPVFKFYDGKEDYICEIRYGGAAANALQRGFWTHTEKAANYFDSLTGGWIDYSDNIVLVKLFSHALVASEVSHEKALEEIKKDIQRLKENLK